MVAERSQRQCSYSTYCRKLCVECDVSLSSSEATIGGCTGQQLRPAAYAAVEFDGDDCIRAAASTRSFFLFFFILSCGRTRREEVECVKLCRCERRQRERICEATKRLTDVKCASAGQKKIIINRQRKKTERLVSTRSSSSRSGGNKCGTCERQAIRATVH